MDHAQRQKLIRRLRAPTSPTEMKRAPTDERPAPTPGDMVGYRSDPALYGPMLLLCKMESGPCRGGYACEVDPPPVIEDGYEPDVAYFSLSELDHADVLWKQPPAGQTGLPGSSRRPL
jgi:hypothetical protein